ncbi:MAG TPA: PqqD family peptide modification chaperone [Acidisarcina sp.]|nr:PqqD family peptide modification chaperone [Acidisarcina sp.]
MTVAIHSNTVIARSATPVSANVAGETVLMSLERSKCYGLGVTGSEIWSRIAVPVRISDLTAQLANEYDAEPSVIERDLLALFEEMAEEGLVEARDTTL